MILDEELCEKKVENKNSRAMHRPEIGITLRLSWYCLANCKIMIFSGWIDPDVIFQMPFKSLYSELCRKSYGHFAKTMHDRSELCTIVFQLNFRGCVVVIGSFIMNESIAGLSNIFILRFYSSIRGRE